MIVLIFISKHIIHHQKTKSEYSIVADQINKEVGFYLNGSNISSINQKCVVNYVKYMLSIYITEKETFVQTVNDTLTYHTLKYINNMCTTANATTFIDLIIYLVIFLGLFYIMSLIEILNEFFDKLVSYIKKLIFYIDWRGYYYY